MISHVHIQYYIINWCHGNSTIINKIQKICNKFLCTAFKCSLKELPAMVLEHKLPSIKQIFYNDVGTFMYRFKSGSLPNALNGLFHCNRSSIATRSQSKLIPTCCRISCSQQSISFVGPKIWNELPIHIKQAKSINCFKHKLKLHQIANHQD